jgi:hypothetical protein
MPKTPKIRLIRDRRRDIDKEIAHLRAQLAALEKDSQDLETAERVLISLGAADAEDTDDEQRQATPTIEARPKGKSGAGKPTDIPTMPEMIISALRDARAGGRRGLEPREMVEYIAAKWWPEVPQNAVGPIAWRMYERHKLTKRESRYFLPKSEDEPAEGGTKNLGSSRKPEPNEIPHPGDQSRH